QEVELAYHIQKVLLPQSIPQIEGFEIATIYKSAQEVGGDYFDFIWVDKDNLGVVVADVSGKGVTASMYMSMLRTALRLVATGERDPKKTLVKVNQLISADLKKGHFVTVFYVILDIPKRMITYASAGHNPLILYSSGEDKFHFLNPRGIPLGLILPEGVSFEQKLQTESLSLNSRDWLFLYSDGITEAMNSRKETFGREKLLNLIKENKNKTAPEFSQGLLELVASFTEGTSQFDDITLVAIKNVGEKKEDFYPATKLRSSAKAKLDDTAP
ncbi:MAG TPA: PP2C family protein-serine/threonine phosphatase, partial [candidate division Zixibacteria bacterium]|nr:PP2C family protein-serine/threonine phosphatase [candidate division Zixibacteria bacterium]